MSRPVSTLTAYLQLVRLPNVFTAAADSLAGWLLVVGTFADPGRWLPLLGASMALYAAGMVLNDLFDLEIDRRERPGRPLPSGRISRSAAAMLGWSLLGLGILLAGVSGSWSSLAVGGILAACIVAYDGGLKHTWAGPFAMGACRGLNVLLGMSQADQLGGPLAWGVPVALGTFVFGVTWISRSEALGGQRAGPIAGAVAQHLGLLALMILAVLIRASGSVPGLDDWRAVDLACGITVLLAVAVVMSRASLSAIREPVPARLQHAVKVGVLSLVWLNVGVVAVIRGPLPALAVAALWVPAFVLAKRLYAT